MLSPSPAPTPTPTLEGTLQPIDRAAELKTLRAAYDAINKNLFKEPDTAALLKASLKELSGITGVIAPNVIFEKDVETNWNIFTESFNRMLDGAKDFKYPKNQLAHRLTNVMALTVGDEHTYFLNAEAYQGRENLINGDNSSIGFGMVVTPQEDKAYIVRVVAGAPADQAGVKNGRPDRAVR